MDVILAKTVERAGGGDGRGGGRESHVLIRDYHVFVCMCEQYTWMYVVVTWRWGVHMDLYAIIL